MHENGAGLSCPASECSRARRAHAQRHHFFILATLSPDFNFPGTGVFVQRALELKDIAASRHPSMSFFAGAAKSLRSPRVGLTQAQAPGQLKK
jgi:hypothetical protein